MKQRTRMRRQKAPSKQIRPMGGHVLNPPEDCECPVIIFRESDETRWADATLCVHYCSPRYCEVAQTQFDESWRVYQEAQARARAKEE